MKTGPLVMAMTGAGILGGVIGAFVFLTFFAEAPRSAAPEGDTASAPLPADLQFSKEEADRLRRVPGQMEEMKAAISSLQQTDAGTGNSPGQSTPAADDDPVVVFSEKQRRINEISSIATLRNSTSAMAQIQASGKIDCDKDGIGEYGTLLEMTGTVRVRDANLDGRGDFSRQGTNVAPAIMSPSMRAVDPDGIVTKNGYCYRVFLPDTNTPPGFVHERGPEHSPGLVGGTGQIGIDMSETTWCMYAWPVKRGETGTRVFFVNQSGDVLQTSNEKAKWSGPDHAPPGNAAFTGFGITSRVAVGTVGNDGDIWKVTN